MSDDFRRSAIHTNVADDRKSRQIDSRHRTAFLVRHKRVSVEAVAAPPAAAGNGKRTSEKRSPAKHQTSL